MKIITDNALVPCQRGRFMGLPITGELTDLTEDPTLAKQVRRAVDKVFSLTKNEAILSGLATRSQEATLYIQVWDRQQPIRTVALHNEGFAGIVHIQIVLPELAEGLYDGDWFGYFRDGLDEFFHVPEDYASDRIWNVRDGMVEMSLPLDTWKWGEGSKQLYAYSVGGNIVFNEEDEE